MHFVISGTWGPTDPTRAMLPFIFAASAVQAGDTVTMMLFHDAVLLAVEGAGPKLVPVGPPNRYEEVAAHPNVTLLGLRSLCGCTRPRPGFT
jgi:tRNA 2-thiouridine synthesizing protein D